jgi:glutaredoxin
MRAILYSNKNQECERAKSLLSSVGVEFIEYRRDNHFTDRGFKSEFGEEAEYPQVTIDYEGFRYRGGLKDTLHFLKQKGLI